MFSRGALVANSCRIAAIGALAIGFATLPGAASAAPFQLFPFITAPAESTQPPAVQSSPSEEQNATVELPARLRRQIVAYPTQEAPGTIIIDTPNTYLYLVLGNGQALSYAIAVGKAGYAWSGINQVTDKREWPEWTPPAEMLQRRPDLPRHMAGGPDNPMGARAIYLGSSLYRIHGSNEPDKIGQAVSSGCIRLTNQDVIDLYNRVQIGATVIVQ